MISRHSSSEDKYCFFPTFPSVPATAVQRISRAIIESLEKRTFLSADAGLAALYSMTPVQSTVVDLSGSGNDATVANSPTIVAGQVGLAMDFSPSRSDRLVVSDSNTLDITSQITISAWVRPDAKRQSMVIVKKGTFDSVDGYELGLSNNGKLFFRLN